MTIWRCLEKKVAWSQRRMGPMRGRSMLSEKEKGESSTAVIVLGDS